MLNKNPTAPPFLLETIILQNCQLSVSSLSSFAAPLEDPPTPFSCRLGFALMALRHLLHAARDMRRSRRATRRCRTPAALRRARCSAGFPRVTRARRRDAG